MQPRGTIVVVNTTKGTIIGSAIAVAATIRSRMVGLLGRARLDPGEGLLILPSSGVHTWGMRFPIDVVALDRHLRVLDVKEHLGSFRIAAVGWTTRSVLELPAERSGRVRSKWTTSLPSLPRRQSEQFRAPDGRMADGIPRPRRPLAGAWG